MIKPLATSTQVVQSKLLNRAPAVCAICDLYIPSFTGLPVILSDKQRIIEFVHPDCCAHDSRL